MGKQHGTKGNRKTGTNQGGEPTTKTGTKRAAMAAPKDTSSSELDSNSSCNNGDADAENCAPEITRQKKGTPLRILFVQYPINIEMS